MSSQQLVIIIAFKYMTLYIVLHHEREHPSIITSVGNHTFSSVKGQEDYDFLKVCFEPVWEEVGEVIAHPILYIKEEQYSLDIVLGSDYKVQ